MLRLCQSFTGENKALKNMEKNIEMFVCSTWHEICHTIVHISGIVKLGYSDQIAYMYRIRMSI